MAVDIGSECLQAWLLRYEGPDGAACRAVLEGGLHRDKKPSPRPLYRYGIVTHKPESRTISTGSRFHNERIVLDIYGPDREALGEALLAFESFDEQPLELDGWMRTEALGGQIDNTPRSIEGQAIFKATVQWIVWTGRAR